MTRWDLKLSLQQVEWALRDANRALSHPPRSLESARDRMERVRDGIAVVERTLRDALLRDVVESNLVKFARRVGAGESPEAAGEAVRKDTGPEAAE